MSVTVLQPGFHTTIQDLGRFGLQKYGIVVGGAMDTLALRIGNMLVGNDENEAAIEVTLFGTRLEFTDNHVIAITGGNLNATLNDQAMAMWRPFLVKKGDVLKFQNIVTGCRAYICIAGGFDIPKMMGSKSTYTGVNIGGYKGRQLKRGDVLETNDLSPFSKKILNHLSNKKRTVNWFVNYAHFYSAKMKYNIRVTLGSEFNYFNKVSQNRLFTHQYKITPNSNRMGYQLHGANLSLENDFELLSEGVTFGTIQVPASGKPIILMADRQTTGGYPKIGEVISVDLPRLAQCKPGDHITFSPVPIHVAENKLIEREEDLQRLQLFMKRKIQ